MQGKAGERERQVGGLSEISGYASCFAELNISKKMKVEKIIFQKYQISQTIASFL